MAEAQKGDDVCVEEKDPPATEGRDAAAHQPDDQAVEDEGEGDDENRGIEVSPLSNIGKDGLLG